MSNDKNGLIYLFIIYLEYYYLNHFHLHFVYSIPIFFITYLNNFVMKFIL